MTQRLIEDCVVGYNTPQKLDRGTRYMLARHYQGGIV